MLVHLLRHIRGCINLLQGDLPLLSFLSLLFSLSPCLPLLDVHWRIMNELCLWVFNAESSTPSLKAWVLRHPSSEVTNTAAGTVLMIRPWNKSSRFYSLQIWDFSVSLPVDSHVRWLSDYKSSTGDASWRTLSFFLDIVSYVCPSFWSLAVHQTAPDNLARLSQDNVIIASLAGQIWSQLPLESLAPCLESTFPSENIASRFCFLELHFLRHWCRFSHKCTMCFVRWRFLQHLHVK